MFGKVTVDTRMVGSRVWKVERCTRRKVYTIANKKIENYFVKYVWTNFPEEDVGRSTFQEFEHLLYDNSHKKLYVTFSRYV